VLVQDINQLVAVGLVVLEKDLQLQLLLIQLPL
jgi:hypothetical protein